MSYLHPMIVNMRSRLHLNERTAIRLVDHAIETKMSDNPRHYHTILHVYQMLERLHEYCIQHTDGLFNNLQRYITLYCAIGLHDIVYIPGSNHNEKESADYARELLSELLPADHIANIVSIIHSTKCPSEHPLDHPSWLTAHSHACMHNLDWLGFLAPNHREYLNIQTRVLTEHIEYHYEIDLDRSDYHKLIATAALPATVLQQRLNFLTKLRGQTIYSNNVYALMFLANYLPAKYTSVQDYDGMHKYAEQIAQSNIEHEIDILTQKLASRRW